MKKIVLILFMTSIVCTLFTACQQKKQSMKMGAYYFAGWSGTNASDDGKPENAWAKGMPSHVTKRMLTEFEERTPIWGWREDTPQLMERQIDLAADHGISFFAFDWYWHDNNGPINLEKIENDSKHAPMKLFMDAKNNSRMEFCLLIANHEPFEITGEEATKQAADYWLTLFKHPRYMKVDGKPLIIIMSKKGIDPKGLAYFQEQAVKAGFKDGVNIASSSNGKPEEGFALKTNYVILKGYNEPSKEHPYEDMFKYQREMWKGSPQQPYIPLFMAGWDRRPWEGPDGFAGGVVTSRYYSERSPEIFKKYLEDMKKWMDEHPEQITKERLAIIYAWNEIGEGGWLVPTRDDPDGAFLKAVKEVVMGK